MTNSYKFIHISLKIASRELESLQRSMTELETVRKSLSEFFCEDPASFKLEDCLRVFHGFCTRFRQAVAENERRKLLEERAAERRRQREEQLAGKRRQCEYLCVTNKCRVLRKFVFEFTLLLPIAI